MEQTPGKSSENSEITPKISKRRSSTSPLTTRRIKEKFKDQLARDSSLRILISRGNSDKAPILSTIVHKEEEEPEQTDLFIPRKKIVRLSIEDDSETDSIQSNEYKEDNTKQKYTKDSLSDYGPYLKVRRSSSLVIVKKQDDEKNN